MYDVMCIKINTLIFKDTLIKIYKWEDIYMDLLIT